MRELLYKEFKLCMHPMVLVFYSFVLMLFIPQYIYTIPFFFMCNGIFYVFQQGLVNNDLSFTVLLPIGKSDAVRARFAFVAILQLIMLLLCIPVIYLCCKMGRTCKTLDVCPTLLGAGLITYSVFNSVFLPGFYKTGVKAGKNFLIASIATFLWIGVCEAFFAVSSAAGDASPLFAFVRDHLDCAPKSGLDWGAQLAFIGAGALIYAVSMALSCRRSIRNFERVDM